MTTVKDVENVVETVVADAFIGAEALGKGIVDVTEGVMHKVATHSHTAPATSDATVPTPATPAQ